MSTKLRGKRRGKVILKQADPEESPAAAQPEAVTVTRKPMEKYLAALAIYFKLKKKYDLKCKKIKKRILRKDISWGEKRNEFRRSVVCIKCNQIGGNIFNKKDRIYTAICGSDSPCGFNIRLKCPMVVFIPNEIEEMNQLLEITKKNIIQKKLEHVFGLADEEAVSADFDDFRNGFRSGSKYLRTLIDKLNESLDLEKKNVEVLAAQHQLYEYISQIKLLLDEFEEEEEEATIKAAIQIYINDILPIQEIIRQNQYSVIEVIKKQKRMSTFFRLNKTKYRRVELEFEKERPKILQFITKIKKREN